MIFDYVETEEQGGLLEIRIGLQFEDEPEALYVAVLKAEGDAVVQQQLLYNGFDCKYSFKPEEQRLLYAYLKEQGISLHS